MFLTLFRWWLGRAVVTLSVFGGLATAWTVGAAELAPLMRDFIGINGHTVQFKPDLYRPVAMLVRDYHPVEWDLAKETGVLPEWPFAKNRVDWSAVYGSWKAKGWRTDVSLMFSTVPRTNWANLEADARSYGRSFAKEFGPSGQRQLVEAVEIGNEPGKWSDADYERIFQSMAEGIREGDAKLKIATCNLTTGPSGDYEKSVTCVEKHPELFDVLNIHTHAQLENWPTWRRSFPEDPRLPKYLHDAEALCRWRDQRAAGKPVWVTEFGYDSTTKQNRPTGDFAKWVGVTDAQQAQWLVRSVLVFSAMPIQRAYLYFFNDADEPQFHGSSGLTRNFEPKSSFYAMAHLQRTLGAYRFDNVVTNVPGTLRVQEYSHETSLSKRVWAVWSPTGEGRTGAVVLENVPGKLVRSETMPFRSGEIVIGDAAQSSDRSVRLTISESPTYLWFEAAR
jgi:hypothetical protein